jgi:hypothetical protein
VANNCTIHGAIFCYQRGRPGSNEFSKAFAKNVAILEELPTSDDWPALTRNMFAVTASSYDEPGFHKSQPIHFAFTTKHFADDWDEWSGKFEGLLYRLSWDKAYVHVSMDWAPEGWASEQWSCVWTNDATKGVSKEMH